MLRLAMPCPRCWPGRRSRSSRRAHAGRHERDRPRLARGRGCSGSARVLDRCGSDRCRARRSGPCSLWRVARSGSSERAGERQRARRSVGVDGDAGRRRPDRRLNARLAARARRRSDRRGRHGKSRLQRAMEDPRRAPGSKALSDVAVAADGSVLIADTGNARVRRIDSTGTIATVAGTGDFGSSGDGGPATSATLATPVSVAATPDGGFLIADAYSSSYPPGSGERADHEGGRPRRRSRRRLQR